MDLDARRTGVGIDIDRHNGAHHLFEVVNRMSSLRSLTGAPQNRRHEKPS
jgi:hypothetical protein